MNEGEEEGWERIVQLDSLNNICRRHVHAPEVSLEKEKRAAFGTISKNLEIPTQGTTTAADGHEQLNCVTFLPVTGLPLISMMGSNNFASAMQFQRRRP